MSEIFNYNDIEIWRKKLQIILSNWNSHLKTPLVYNKQLQFLEDKIINSLQLFDSIDKEVNKKKDK